MSILEALILGIVEGLTEFLPVSSTGHLILTKALLKLEDDVDLYLVTIQLGATLAVALYYRERIVSMLGGIFGKDKEGRKLFLQLIVAFIPAAVFGLLFDDLIETHFFNPMTVAIALILGGIIMIGAEWRLNKVGPRIEKLEDMNYKDALIIGFSQCAALWPGMSRSMSTIVGGQLRGLSNRVAADFSFLLALPTLGAATCYTLLKSVLKDDPNLVSPADLSFWVGMVTSFVVGWLAVATFLKFLKKVGMAPFGYYRIIVGLVTIGCILLGIL